MKKILLFLALTAMIFSSAVPFALGAQGQQIEIIFSDGGEYLENAEFSVYYLGGVSGGRISPDETFSDYKVSFDVSDSEKTAALAETLWAYALRDDIAPDYTDSTDSKGTADFEGKVLPEGAYLVAAEKHYSNGTYYFCKPFILLIPYGETQTLTVTPKFERVNENTESLEISYRVMKAWVQDEGGIRPVEIQVQLLCDGDIYDTVVLSSENNWRYRWDNLSALNHWTVTEKTVVGDYVVSLSSQEKAFLLTNSGDIGDKEPTIPETPTTAPDKTTKPDEPTTEPEEELPVTGLLRWPVPYLAMAGVLVFIIGYVKYRKSEAEDE